MRRLPQNSCARAAGQQRQRYGGSFSRLRARTPVSYGSQGARVVCIQFRCCACYGSRGSARNDGPVRLYPIFPVFFFLVLLTSTRSPSATEETTLISSRLVWTKQVVLDLLHDLCAPLSIFTLRLQSQHTTPKENKSRRFLSQFNPILFACGTSASCHSSV
jgi:hypothetical protein